MDAPAVLGAAGAVFLAGGYFADNTGLKILAYLNGASFSITATVLAIRVAMYEPSEPTAWLVPACSEHECGAVFGFDW